MVALLMAAAGVSLLPPVFGRLLTLEDVGAGPGAWLPGCGLLLLALAVVILRRRIPPALLALLLGILLMLGAELGLRAYTVTAFPPMTREEMARAYTALFQDRQGRDFVAHPFLHYTGVPNREGFGPNGFLSPMPAYSRTPGVTRVACLGGSTTANGYPGELQKYLNRKAAPARHEVLNFGLSGYSSVHSLVNLVLNVTDFKPDYLVIHHGWNDQGTCEVRCARGDYSHKYLPKIFRRLSAGEKLLIRVSYIYRALVLHRVNDWFEPIEAMEEREYGPCKEDLCQLGGRFYHYRRNLETMIIVARGRGMVPVLATMPHATRAPDEQRHRLPRFKEANEVMRQVAAAHPGQALLVDLDAMMTGKMEQLFTDLGHMELAGQQFKAQAIGQAILEHVKEQGSQPGSG